MNKKFKAIKYSTSCYKKGKILSVKEWSRAFSERIVINFHDCIFEEIVSEEKDIFFYNEYHNISIFACSTMTHKKTYEDYLKSNYIPVPVVINYNKYWADLNA